MRRIAILVLASLLLLTACGQTQVAAPTATVAPTAEPTVEPTPEPTATPEPTVAPTAEPTPTPAPASLTSGLPSGKEYKPVCVMIDNYDARPQAGIGQADIVYESLMENRSATRLMCVFNDTLPEYVGPVRSCRAYFIDMAQEYGTVLAFFGGPDNTAADIYPKLKASNIRVVANGMTSKYGGYFWRIKERNAPHNVYTNIVKLSELLTEPVEPVSHFLFDANVTYSGDDVASVRINKNSMDVLYEYDAAAAAFKRTMKGEPMIDSNTDAQVAVKNVIMQYVDVGSYGTAKGHLKMTLTGSGKADIFILGKHIKATWKRAKINEITKFYDESGNEIAMQPGNTWIEILPDDWKDPLVLG